MLASNPLACVQQQRLCNAYQKRWHGQHARLWMSDNEIRSSEECPRWLRCRRHACPGPCRCLHTALAVIEFVGPLSLKLLVCVRPSAWLKRRTRGCCCWDACCCRCSSLGCWFCALRRTRRRVLRVVKWRSQDFELGYFHN
jgi:hypothetical protein